MQIKSNEDIKNQKDAILINESIDVYQSLESNKFHQIEETNFTLNDTVNKFQLNLQIKNVDIIFKYKHEDKSILTQLLV